MNSLLQPPIPDALRECLTLHSEVSAQFAYRERAAVADDRPNRVAAVLRLLLLRRPTDIANLVVSGVVRVAIEGQRFVRALAKGAYDVFLELCELRPLRTILDSACAVAFVLGMSNTVAAGLHVFPNRVEVVIRTSGGTTMTMPLSGHDLPLQAAARLCLAHSETIPSDDACYAAVAHAVVVRPIVGIGVSFGENKPATELSVNHKPKVATVAHLSTIGGVI